MFVCLAATMLTGKALVPACVIVCSGYIGEFEIVDDHRAGKIVIEVSENRSHHTTTVLVRMRGCCFCRGTVAGLARRKSFNK